MPDPIPYTPSLNPDDLPFQSSDLRALMQQYHDAINAQVDGTLNDLAARWAPVRATMDLEITRLQQQMEQALARGDTLTASWLAEAQRLNALKGLVEGNVAQFAAAAQQDIGAAQLAAIQAGGAAAQETLQASVPPGVNYTFGVPPQSVMAQFAGALQDGSPLAALFATFGPEAADRAGQALFTSLALGENPRVAAQRLQWATDLPRQRAEVIARTEILRSWRSAQLANYRANSDVVQGWQWSCDFSPRSCSACIALDGTIHLLEEELDDHICGRCSALPLTGSWGDILRDAGVAEEDIPPSLLSADAQAVEDATGGMGGRMTAGDWLAQQTPEIQNQIMGPAKAEAWRQGAFELRDLIGVRHDPQWGSSIQELSLKQMGLDAQVWLAKARGAGNGSALAEAEAQAAAEASAREMKTAATAPLSEWEQQRASSIAQAEADAAEQAAARPTEWEQQRQAMIDQTDQAQSSASTASMEPPFTADQMTAALSEPDVETLGGINGAKLVTLDDQQYIVKTLENSAAYQPDIAGMPAARYQALAEVANTQIARELGFGDYVTPTYLVESGGQAYIASAVIEDARSWADLGVSASAPDPVNDPWLLPGITSHEIPGIGDIAANVATEDLRNLTLQEYVAGDFDRNLGNYLYNAENQQVYLIDQSFALRPEVDATYTNLQSMALSAWEKQVAPAAGTSGDSAATWAAMPLDPAQLQQIVAHESQLIAILQAQGMDAAVPALQARLDVLRQVSELPQPTYADLQRLGDAKSLEMQAQEQEQRQQQ